VGFAGFSMQRGKNRMSTDRTVHSTIGVSLPDGLTYFGGASKTKHWA
jgi:hypothetical protein